MVVPDYASQRNAVCTIATENTSHWKPKRIDANTAQQQDHWVERSSPAYPEIRGTLVRFIAASRNIHDLHWTSAHDIHAAIMGGGGACVGEAGGGDGHGAAQTIQQRVGGRVPQGRQQLRRRHRVQGHLPLRVCQHRLHPGRPPCGPAAPDHPQRSPAGGVIKNPKTLNPKPLLVRQHHLHPPGALTVAPPHPSTLSADPLVT